MNNDVNIMPVYNSFIRYLNPIQQQQQQQRQQQQTQSSELPPLQQPLNDENLIQTGQQIHQDLTNLNRQYMQFAQQQELQLQRQIDRLGYRSNNNNGVHDNRRVIDVEAGVGIGGGGGGGEVESGVGGGNPSTSIEIINRKRVMEDQVIRGEG